MIGRIPSAPRQGWIRLAAYALLAVGLVFVHLALVEFATDDAYIHFRIARNWLEWGAPYYNRGEAVLGSSSPAWTLVLGGLFFATGVQVPAVAVLNGVVLTGVVLMASQVLREAGDRPWWFTDTVALLLILPLVLEASIVLMEVPLAIFGLMAGMWLHLRDSRASLAVLAGAACVRLELTVLFALVLLEVAMRKPFRETAVRAGGAALVVALLVGFLLAYFGTVIPHTLHAKGLVYELSRTQTLHQVLWTIPRPPAWSSTLGMTLWLLVPLLLLREAFRVGSLRRDALRTALLLICAGGGIAGAYIVREVMLFNWYPPLYLVPVALAVALLLSTVPARWWAGLVLLLLLYPAGGAARNMIAPAFEPVSDVDYRPFQAAARTQQYLAVGEELYDRYPDATLLAPEIGGLGFTFPGHIYDGVGLVTPRALAYHPMAIPAERQSGALGALPVGLVREVDPDLIVSLDIFVEAFQQSELRSRYRVSRRPVLPPDMTTKSQPTVFGARHLLVFRKNQLTEKDGASSGGATGETTQDR